MKGCGWIWSPGQRVHIPALVHLHMKVPPLSLHMWYVQTRLRAFSGTSPLLKDPISSRDSQTFAPSPSQPKSNLSTKFYFEMLCIRVLRIEKQQLSKTGRCFSVYLGLLHTGVKLGHCTQVPALPKQINTTPKSNRGSDTDNPHDRGRSWPTVTGRCAASLDIWLFGGNNGQAMFCKKLKNYTVREVSGQCPDQKSIYVNK